MRPQAKTIRNVIAHLEELGLSVYGQTMHADGQQYPSLMDYDAEDILLRRKHIEKETLREPETY